MSYTQAAGAGTNSGSSSQNGNYCNDKMVVHMANGFSYDQLSEDLDKCGIWKYVSGYQKVDFNKRFAVVIEHAPALDFLVERGLDVNGVHARFSYRMMRADPRV